jgi:hypothetical protein
MSLLGGPSRVSRLLMTYLMLKDLQSLSVVGLGSPNRRSHRIAAGHTEQRRNFVVAQSGVRRELRRCAIFWETRKRNETDTHRLENYQPIRPPGRGGLLRLRKHRSAKVERRKSA